MSEKRPLKITSSSTTPIPINAVTVQTLALHFEIAHPMLVNRIAYPCQRPLAAFLCELQRCQLL